MEANLAVLIDFENIQAGASKENLGAFDVDALMKRLKDKGRILVSRSYADWGRFSRFKQQLLGANVTMMELTSHGMQDKNRADIAMVVDCLELAFTKDYIDTFVVVSGDSDFTPLVLKMRELNKKVIGVGTRGSTSRLLVQACDEFLFYDAIIREHRHHARPVRPVAQAASQSGDDGMFELLAEALEGLQRENPEPALASVVKTAVLRKSPDFDEVDLGWGTFAKFLETAAAQGWVRLTRDNKSGGYRVDAAPDTESSAESDDRPRGEDPNWVDPYLPEGATPFVGPLRAAGIDPLAHATRMTVLGLIDQIVNERRKKRHRVTTQFVQDDVKKRLKKNHPDVPSHSVKALFNALGQAGLLLHPKDSRPIRSGSAPFVIDRSAEALNERLVEMWLEKLRALNVDMGNTSVIAALFYGEADRRRKVEETLAWLATRPEGGSAEVDLDDFGDDALLVEEPAPAPVEAAPAPAAEDASDAESDDDDKKKPRRRRRRKKGETVGEMPDADEVAAEPAAEVLPDDLDALLETD